MPPRPQFSAERAATRRAAWFVLLASSACSTILEFDEPYVLGDPNAAGGMMGAGGTGAGGMAATCPDDEQDNDADGTCEAACDAGTCNGRGACDDSSGSATCTCDERFSGDDCASCAEGYGGSECSDCTVGHQDLDGDGTCLPACTAATCANDGTCDDSTGTTTCTCRPDFDGADCATACGMGTAGPGCAFRLMFGLDIPAPVANWDEPSDVPYDTDDSATAGAFDRIAYRLILDDEEVWVEMDPFTTDAAELGVPVDVLHDRMITNVTVRSFSANQPSIETPTSGNVEMWGHCYSAGPNGEYDYDDDITVAQQDCYGCLQIHVDMLPVLSINRWSSANGDVDIGIGPSPSGNPDYTFEENAGGFTVRRLEVYVREN